MTEKLVIREVKRSEYVALGELMFEVYSELDGFPTPEEQPEYYEMLLNIGSLNEEKDAKVLVAVAAEKGLLGGIVYIGDMTRYGSGGTATQERNASGIRLLCVDPGSQGMGVGKTLTRACIKLAKDKGHDQVILHTTQAMQVAWHLYQKMGFERSAELDFSQNDFPIFGFRLRLPGV